MGLFGDTMGMMGGVARGTASASMWTGNMIYTALQNARTKKEIRALYKNASNANFQNRAVAVLPGVSKQQLLLTSGEPNDNDVYDYQSQSGTAALDYIWGETDTPNSVIVSGGQNKERVCALIPFVHKAQAKNIPVIALHTGNADLEHMMQNHSRAAEFISRKGAFYDVFRSMPVDDIAFLLYETMPSGTATPAAESLLRALIEVLLLTDGKITLQNLASFPLITLKGKIDAMYKGGLLNDDEYDEINHYCMAGSSDTDAVRIFLNRLNRQSEAIYGKPLSNFSNTKKMLNQKGVIAIDVGTITALILLKMKSYAEEQGHDVRDVVISCPVYYGYEERNAIKQAGTIAGLNVLSIINTTTAVTLYYLSDGEMEEDKRILVYDLGGTTFNLSLLELQLDGNGKPSLKVIKTDGNEQLGGCEWDARLFDCLLRKYAYENGLNDSDLDDELRATIAALVEKLKIKLSALERVSCSVRHSGDRTRLEVTREEFEELSQDLVHQTIDYVHKLLSDANLKASDVDTVLLVGGSTRMPMIRNAVEAVFPGKIRGEDSNLAISKGAALCSKLL